MRADVAGLRRYEQVATISATCSPGNIPVCEQSLRERACELEADAVIVDRQSAGGSPFNASTQTLASRSGRAVRWVDPPQASAPR